MIIVTLAEAKQFLDVIHDADDAKLQSLLDASTDEAMQFMDREFFEPSSSDWWWEESSSENKPWPDGVKLGIKLLLQANYQATPADALQLRTIAQIKLMPYRKGLGV